MSEGYVDIGSGSLWVKDEGSGQAIVFLHGFSFDHRQWEPQMEALADSYRCISYDLRGFGRSAPPDSRYDHVLDLHALLDALELESPVLVGLSLGANIAMAFSARYPKVASKMVLVSSGLPGFEWSEQRPPEAAKAHADAYGVTATKDFWLNHSLFASLEDYPVAKSAVHTMVADYSGWHWENTDPRDFNPPGQDPQSVTCPTLVMRGGRDMQGYRDIAATLAESIREASLVTFEDSGHMLNLEEPERFNSLLADFVDSQEEMS